MKIERNISFGSFDDNTKGSEQTKNLSHEERISLLEELRYDIGELTGHDYSRRFERSFSVVKRQQC